MKRKTETIVLCGVFTALMCAGAFIRIPIPPVPVTMQLEFAVFAGLLLGKKQGVISIVVYIIVGLIGVPVFTGGGGIGYILSPTFGYIIGFALGSFVSGSIIGRFKQHTYTRYLAASLFGMIAVYSVGVLYYWLIMTFYMKASVGVSVLIINCFLIFVPADTVLCVLFSYMAYRIKKTKIL